MTKLPENQATVDRDDLRLWLRLLGCATVVEKRLRRRFVEQFDSTLPRFDILAALDRASGGLTMGHLSKALLVSNGNVTALVRQLEHQGLVSSRRADDRRSTIVTLTSVGRARFEELAAAHQTWISGMFAAITTDDQRALHDLLAILAHSIASEGRHKNVEK